MRNKILTIGTALVPMVGTLLVSAVAWGQAEETLITWRNIGYQILEEAERQWVDEDGIEHGRDEMYRNPRRGDLIGDEVGWVSWDWDPGTGDYFERGHFAYTGSVLGSELTGGIGHYTIECHRIAEVRTCTGDDLIHLDGGDLVKTSAAWEGNINPLWSGILLEPSRGGAKKRSK